MTSKNILSVYILLALLLTPSITYAQFTFFKQQKFHKQLPPGNYSGIAPLGNERYAVVSDKSETDGFYIFHLSIDTITGKIIKAENEGFFSCGLPNRDMEGIAYCPVTNTLFISGEKDNEVYEYDLNGKRTGRRLEMPACYKTAGRNLGLESLTYDTYSHRFFTTSERVLPGDSMLRIQSFDDNLLPLKQYLYLPDEPISRKYYHGVSEICALDDGKLLVIERQLRIPKLKIGAKAIVRIYYVEPLGNKVLKKHLLTEFSTRINLLSRKFANFEGLCTPFPNWLLLMADSQNRAKGMLRDWMRLIKID